MKICMRTPEAADYLGVTKSTLEKRRLTGDGPSYVKAGRSVRNCVSDLDQWLDAHIRRSTSEPQAAD